jgi:hypothetical protein
MRCRTCKYLADLTDCEALHSWGSDRPNLCARSGAPSNKKSGTSHASSTARRTAVYCRLPCNRHPKLVGVRTGSVLFARSAARLSWRLPVLNLRSMYGQCVWYKFLLRCQSAICICAPAARLLTGLLKLALVRARDARLRSDPLRKLRGSFLYQHAARTRASGT